MMSNKKAVLKVKIVLDIIMALVLVLLYNKRAISMSFHEMAGLGVFGLFIIHLALNGKWIAGATKKLFQKGTHPRLRIQWIVNTLLFITFAIIIVTGLMIAKTLPYKISGFDGAQKLHYFAAALSIILMGVHLGLHWSSISSVFNKLPLRASKAVKVLCSIVLVAALGWGCFSMVSDSFARWIMAPFTTMEHMGGPNGEGFNPENFNPDDFKKDENSQDFDNAKPPTDDNKPAEGEIPNGERPEGKGPKGERPQGKGPDGKQPPFGKGEGKMPTPPEGGFGGPKGPMGQGEHGGAGMGGPSGMGSSSIPMVMITFASEMIVFAFITALIDSLLKKRKKQQLMLKAVEE